MKTKLFSLSLIKLPTYKFVSTRITEAIAVYLVVNILKSSFQILSSLDTLSVRATRPKQRLINVRQEVDKQNIILKKSLLKHFDAHFSYLQSQIVEA